MNEITKITRKSIFDKCRLSGLNIIPPSVSEVEFWERIFDLTSLPSTDSRYKNMAGDLFQHRINNPQDWGEYWFLSDSRINVLESSDDNFLKFLSETIHPLVRSELTEISELLTLYNEELQADGFAIVEDMQISGKVIYKGSKIGHYESTKRISQQAKENTSFLNSKYLITQIEGIRINIATNPEQSIGMCKEIIESYCKAVLSDNDEVDVNKYEFMPLVKRANTYMHLVPENLTDKTEGEKIIKTLLHSLNNIIQQLDELRNAYGTGHGKSPKYIGLQKRHADLAINLTSSLLAFWAETYRVNKK